MNILETLASGLLSYSRSEPEGLLARGLRQPAGLLGRGLNNAINMQGPGLLDQQDAFFRPSVMNTPEQTRADGAAFLQNIATGPLGMAPMGIVKPEVAKTLNTARKLPDSADFAEAVANTPSAQITPDGLLMRVARNQKPEQGLEPSVRGGVFYLPEGAAQMKYYSHGRSGYGGSEAIRGETLISNPLLAKGGTGGKAPEAAYDSLVGKGSYQNMRNDALDAVSSGGWGGTHQGGIQAKINAAQKFLSRYAPELAYQAEHIVRNSRQGNQLAYALQEAAVGSAVRNAGHDAVIGFSKGKKGKFISEVFDVREMNYPDKFGTPTGIWDAFKSRASLPGQY